MTTSKALWNVSCGIPNNSEVRIKCPVEEIGKNSVKPSTIPKIIA